MHMTEFKSVNYYEVLYLHWIEKPICDSLTDNWQHVQVRKKLVLRLLKWYCNAIPTYTLSPYAWSKWVAFKSERTGANSLIITSSTVCISATGVEVARVKRRCWRSNAIIWFCNKRSEQESEIQPQDSTVSVLITCHMQVAHYLWPYRRVKILKHMTLKQNINNNNKTGTLWLLNVNKLQSEQKILQKKRMNEENEEKEKTRPPHAM